MRTREEIEEEINRLFLEAAELPSSSEGKAMLREVADRIINLNILDVLLDIREKL